MLFAVSCRTKKTIVTAPAPQVNTGTKIDTKPANLMFLKGKDLPFNTLSLKGKTSLDMDGDQHDVTLNIRIQKDKKIWVSVTAIAGIEAARLVVTPDSLLLRNNLQKTYTKKPFSYLHSFTNKQVTFSLLQSILSGNTISDLMVPKSDLVQENGVWVLSGNAGDVTYRVLFNTLLKVAETSLNSAESSQAFKASYGNYTPVNNSLFPSSLKINSMAGAKKINVKIDFVKIESNVPVEFPFTVPKNFEVIN